MNDEPAPPAEEEPSTAAKPLADTVTAIAGAITAAAALVVVPGGIAMALRLHFADLPGNLGVVSSLPSQLLLAVGGAYILFPLVVAMGLAVLVALVAGARQTPNRVLIEDKPRLWPANNGLTLRLWPTSKRLRLVSPVSDSHGLPSVAERVALSTFVVAAFVWMLYAVRWPGAWPWESGPWLGGWIWEWLAVPLAALLTIIVWLVGARIVARRYRLRAISFAAVALMAGLTTAVGLPWAIALSVVRGELPATTVCRPDGTRLDGVLIGEASDRVYLGELPAQVVVFINRAGNRTLRRDLKEALNNEDLEVKIVESPRDIGFGRVGLVVADVPSLHGPRTVHRLFYKPETEHVRFVVFPQRERFTNNEPPQGKRYPNQKRPKGFPQKQFDPVKRQLVADRDDLLDLVHSKVDVVADDIPDRRRITSVPTDHVSRLLIGRLGPCPREKTAG